MFSLKFKTKHKSIDKFEDIDMSDFSIITGLNGSGKTHLLESIKSGCSVINGIESSDINYFNYLTFAVDDEQQYSSVSVPNEKKHAWELLKKNNNSDRVNLSNNLHLFKTQLGDGYRKLVELARVKNKPLLQLDDLDIEDDELRKSFSVYLMQFSQLFNQSNAQNNPVYQGIKSLAYQIFDTVDSLSEVDFKDKFQSVQLKGGFIPTQMSRIFLEYEYKKFDYLVVKKAESLHYNEPVLINNEKEFEDKFGPKPWVVLEEVLNKFSSLNFSITNPEGLRFRADSDTIFTLKIINNDSKIEVPFTQLSSGEKVLFSLIYSIYKSNTGGYFPKVLLLDEIDASLHPSMIRNLLVAINDNFVNGLGMKVVLATHSPTTVSLSDEESIYIVNKGVSYKRIEKQTKFGALNILTEGYFTLDEGMNLLRFMSVDKLHIISEGNNKEYINRSIELLSPDILQNIEYFENIEDKSGKNQLYVLYDFFSRIEHSDKVLFVFDCDVNFNGVESNNTYYYVLPRNKDNSKFENGIENLFPDNLVLPEHYIETIKKQPNGTVNTILSPNKSQILSHIISHATESDFSGFYGLIVKIKSII